MKRTALVIAFITMVVLARAQDGPRGHWTGTVEVPGQPLNMEVDLDKTASGWVGTLGIPSQNASGLPLDGIAFTDGKWTFRIKGAPGGPAFIGTLSEDGKTLSGDFTQGTASFPFKFTRTGDPKIEAPKPSPPLEKQFLGTWEGTLGVGRALRLVLKLSNETDGAKGVLISLDQGGVEIPVTEIEQKDSKLKLVVKMVGGQYQAEMNKESTELSGTWTQAGNDLPLKLTKSADKK